METKKLFISQPMNGLSNEEIEKERARILEAVKKMEFTNEDGSKWDLKDTNTELIDSFFKDAPHDVKPLWFLGESFELLSTADIVYFGNLFANPAKSNYSIIKKSGNVTYCWDLEATTPVAPSSKELNNWISGMEELGFECIIKRVIPLSEALEKHPEPIDEVLLARSHGYYSVAAIFENALCLSPTYYFVSEKAIFQISLVLTKQG